MTQSGQTAHLSVSIAEPDIWTSNPLTITSTLELGVTLSRKIDENTPGPWYSPSCGLGWRFWFNISTSDQGAVGGVNVKFDPFYLAGATGYGQMSSSATVQAIDHDTNHPKAVSTKVDLCTQAAQKDRYGSQTPSYVVDLISQWVPWDASVPIGVRYRINITIGFGKSIAVPAMVSSNEPKLRLIRSSIITGKLPDVKFVLYSRRRGRELSHPKALFGSLEILVGHCSYLDTLIKGTEFRQDGDSATLPETSQISDCEYESDSDFDEGELEGLPTGKAPSSPAVQDDARDDGTPNTEISSGSQSKFDGRVVLLEKYAFKTWKALLDYLYGGHTQFAELSSRDTERKGDLCSPKSMYRLADELNLPNLKAQAFSAIKQNITAENLIPELFLQFTHMYPEVEECELQLLMKQPFEDLAGLEETIAQFGITGGSAHSAHILTEIIRRSLTPAKKASSYLMDNE